MLGSLKWRITCRWGAVLQHLGLLLISCYVICSGLACFCNTLWLILDPEYRFEFQQLKPMPWASHLSGAGDAAYAFTAPATQPVSCRVLRVRLCWCDLPTLISLLYSHEGGERQRCCLAIARAVPQITLQASTLLRGHMALCTRDVWCIPHCDVQYSAISQST